jgi:hypothetical protein
MKRTRLSRWLGGLLGLALGACSPSGSFWPACDRPAFDGQLTVPARDGVAAAPFSLDVTASGTGDVRSIAISGNRGLVAYGSQSVDFLFHQRIPYPGTLVLFQGFGSVVGGGGSLHFMWLYCDGGRLEKVYYETTATAGTYLPVTGTCAETAEFVQVPTHLDALDVEVPRLSCGVSITSQDGSIQLGGSGPGTMFDDGGTPRTALVFNALDCRDGCDAPGLGLSWFELHVLLWDPSKPVLDYAMLYLFTSGGATTGSRAILDYGYSISQVAPMFRTKYDCEWSVQ